MVFHVFFLKWLDAIHGTNDNNWSKWFGANRLGSSDLIHSTRDLKSAAKRGYPLVMSK